MRVAILVPNFVGFDGSAQEARLHAEALAAEGNYVAIFTFAAKDYTGSHTVTTLAETNFTRVNWRIFEIITRKYGSVCIWLIYLSLRGA